MPRSLGDNTSASSSKYHGNGVFTEKLTIVEVEDFSNYPLKTGVPIKAFDGGFEPQICLRMVVSNEGNERKMIVFGEFSHQIDKISGKKIKYLGWKERGNSVQNLLFKLGVGESKDAILDDDSINPVVLTKMIGLEFVKLRYCAGEGEGEYAGKPDWKDWGVFESTKQPDAEETLHRAWLKVAQYFSKYNPTYYESWSDANRAEESTFDPSKMDEPETEDVFE